MATLNQAETEGLRDAMRILNGVLREGFDPNDANQKIRALHIKRAHDKVKAVVTMKGYYPK